MASVLGTTTHLIASPTVISSKDGHHFHSLPGSSRNSPVSAPGGGVPAGTLPGAAAGRGARGAGVPVPQHQFVGTRVETVGLGGTLLTAFPGTAAAGGGISGASGPSGPSGRQSRASTMLSSPAMTDMY